MKGSLFDWLAVFVLLGILLPFIFLAPHVLKSKIQAQYSVNIKTLAPEDFLISILSTTNLDEINAKKRKPTLEIIGERMLLNQNLNFLEEDLSKLVKSKCYIFETESVKLDKSCEEIKDKIQKSKTFKIVLPFNTNKMVENVKLVVK